MPDVKGKKIYVGLSGGVDSAVSAALLNRAGAEVTGVFIKGWYPPGMPCTWAVERRDAMRVAARLHIPFETLDASAEYRKGVIDYLLAEYRAGRTPNPDVMCNREVKFGVFYDFARRRGADTIATGHYRSGEKDQSYFLWAVPREILHSAIFPVGKMEKDEVRRRAQSYSLPVAAKKDSQGICFLGSVSVDEFLRSTFDVQVGRAVDEAGNYVGDHDGALLVTLGQRVALRGTVQGPWYVRAKDIAANELVVGRQVQDRRSSRTAISFLGSNWIGTEAQVAFAQCRYRGCRVTGYVEGTCFVPTMPITDPVTPGQSLVFYDDAVELVGGGIIE